MTTEDNVHTLKTRMMVSTIRKIDDETAKQQLVEARVNVSGKLDVYENHPNRGFIQRVFTLDIDPSWDNGDPDMLLEYARNNMPSHLTLGG